MKKSSLLLAVIALCLCFIWSNKAIADDKSICDEYIDEVNTAYANMNTSYTAAVNSRATAVATKNALPGPRASWMMGAPAKVVTFNNIIIAGDGYVVDGDYECSLGAICYSSAAPYIQAGDDLYDIGNYYDASIQYINARNCYNTARIYYFDVAKSDYDLGKLQYTSALAYWTNNP